MSGSGRLHEDQGAPQIPIRECDVASCREFLASGGKGLNPAGVTILLDSITALRASLGERDATIAALQQEIDELRVYSLGLANTLRNVTQEMEGEL